jgi:hypothetical protein
MRKLRIAALLLVVAAAAAQLHRPERTNPPVDPGASFEAVVKPPAQAAAVLERSCRDCHSHRTEWPWYSSVAPMSWVVARDVNQGRAHLNLSRWNVYSDEMSGVRINQMCEEVKTGEMPPKYYTPLHPEARPGATGVAAVCGIPRS